MKYIKIFESFSKKQNNIDRLLDKISKSGIDSLTDYELKILSNGGEDKLSEEIVELGQRIMDNLNDGFFVKVDLEDLGTFFDILERNGVKVQRNCEWEKWGTGFWFILTENGLKHDNKQPNHDTYFPTFPKK